MDEKIIDEFLKENYKSSIRINNIMIRSYKQDIEYIKKYGKNLTQDKINWYIQSKNELISEKENENKRFEQKIKSYIS